MKTYEEERIHARGYAGLSFEPVVDAARNRFQLVLLGWKGDERIYHLIFHADIIGEKIWIQEDKTEESLAEMLVEKGVPKKEIVLAYYPDYHRQHTEFAVA